MRLIGSIPCPRAQVNPMNDMRSSDEAPACLCQTLAQTALARFYAPHCGYSAVYEIDLAWFSRHKNSKRRWFIRQSFGPEFETIQLTPTQPRLWVIVGELSPGFHLVLPVWRGPPFFRVCTFKYVSVADVSSDFEIAAILDECLRRGGVDQDAMLQWQAEIREASEPQRALTGPSWGR